MGDNDLNSVISTLRPCLLSAKGGISFRNLDEDYKQIVGKPIPYANLGYKTLGDFLENVPGLQITRQGADWIVTAKPTDGTVHLSRMIAKQKSASKKRSRALTSRSRRPSQGSWRPPSWPSQMPRSLAQSRRSPQTNYRTSQSARTQQFVPLMAIAQKKPIPSLFDKPPRYMVPNSGSQHISPSKRLSDRMANSSQSSSSSPVVAYKNKAAFEAAQAAPTVQQPPPLLPNPVPSTSRPGLIRETPSHRNPEVTRNSETNRNQTTTPLRPLSERLKVSAAVRMQPASTVPEIISPLSPIQLISGGLNSAACAPRQIPSTPPRPNPEVQSIRPQSPQDPCPTKQLERLARSMDLAEPAYSISTWTIGHKMFYGCNVKVGGTSYRSYPEEILSSDDAKKAAAAKAVKELSTREAPQCGLVQTTNRNLVKERLTKIVGDHENGVFMRQIPTYYTENFTENLPDDWEKIVEECPGISKEKGAHDAPILCPYVSRQEPNDRVVADILSPRMEKIQLNPIGPPAPGVLRPPPDQFWDVLITSVTSTVDIWARLIGEEYSDKFAAMQNDMEAYYKSLSSNPGSGAVEVGKYYAVQEQDSWHRVQCFEFDNATGEAIVFFIDHGDEEKFQCRRLYPLEKKFCVVPAQALNLSLVDLEEFSERWEVTEVLGELLHGEALVAQVITREAFENDGEITASVVLWDTKSPTDVNLNEVLLTKISQSILVPKLSQEGQVSEVFLSHVTETGDAYLHLKSDSMDHLRNLLNKLIQTGLTTEDVLRSEVKKIDASKVYLARCFEDGNWYRGIVTNIESNNQARVFLVDFGKTITVDKKVHLLALDQLSAVLAKYPYQALKVRLNDIPDLMFNRELAGRLTELAPPSAVLLAKVVIPASRSSPAVVELFTRVAPNNLLVSINNTLAIDTDLIGSNGDGNNNTRSRKRLERTISRHGGNGDAELITKNLRPPKIPNFGNYFDIHITMAANPGNFTVQPFDDRMHLEAMMVQLQEVCVNYSGPSPTPESIKEGSLYAAKHFDSHYYRVCISKIINEEMVTVYFCDFGDVSVLTLDKLQPLGRQFLDLPYQAIRARLVGVQPVNMDWSVEDCLRYQELVVERNFVSIVVDSGPDRLSPSDTVLGLKLIDVSGDTDVYLDKLLIAEGRGTSTDV